VASAISKLGIGTIFRAAMPFLIANIVTLILITYIPHLIGRTVYLDTFIDTNF